MPTPDSTTGTSLGGEGVPVVDLTATIQGLYAHAEAARERAAMADDLAASCRRQSDYLEDLAATLDGSKVSRTVHPTG